MRKPCYKTNKLKRNPYLETDFFADDSRPFFMHFCLQLTLIQLPYQIEAKTNTMSWQHANDELEQAVINIHKSLYMV